MNVIGLAKYYHCRPSSFLNESTGEYEKFCFDEVCAYIDMRVEDGEKPRFKKLKVQGKHYKSFKDFYKEFED